MRIKKTKKLFYNKYPYKVETKCKGASLVARRGVDSVLNFCKSSEDTPYNIRQQWYDRGNNYTPSDKISLHKFTKTVQPLIEEQKGENLRIRFEGWHANFFTDDVKLYKQLQKILKTWIIEVTEPASQEDLEFLLANGSKKIIVDALPYNKFNYKILLKTSMKPDKRASFAQWLGKYSEDTFRPTKTTLKWLTGEARYVQAPYIYVANKSMMSMLGLYISGEVKRVEEYVYRSSLMQE